MKNYQSTLKPNDQLINMLRKLLQWISHLELSGSYEGEKDVGRQMPESSLVDSKERIIKYNNQAKTKSKIKPNNRLTKLILQLHHCLSHLELSGGFVGEQDVG